MRPLDPVTSLKTKLGLVIVAAVGVTVAVFTVGVRLGIPIVVLALIAGALSLAMIQVLARGMTSPLREMAEAAAAMAGGDYSKRVTATSRDEVGRLASSFNAMAAELAETDRIRRDLVANVSHDLRTPLSSLRVTLENMIDGVTPLDDQALTAMLTQVDRLGTLVDQLLELSRLESGAIPFEPIDTDVTALLRRTVAELGPHNPRIEMSVQPMLRAGVDPDRLHQAVSNLLHNALRHSPKEEPVRLSAWVAHGSLTIEVTDSGPGLAPGEAEKVFERFYRGDSARSADEGGAGLGLAIARWIVDLHGGSIEALPAEPSGCRMVIRIPVGAS